MASAIPRGLPARTDADSRRLAQGINQWLQRNGRGSGFDAQTVQQESLPDAIASALTAFEQATGTRVVVFRNLTPDVDDFNGVNFGDGVVYVNEDSQNPIISTASHEWLHHLRKTQPLLYQQLADEVERQGNLHSYQQRLKNDGESSWQDMDVVTEELTAAATGDAMTDAEFLQRIAQSNRGLFQRVAQSFLKFLDTLTGRWRNQGSNQYLQDVQAFRDKLAHVLQQLETSSTTGSTQDTDAEVPRFSRKAGDAQQQFKDTERAYGGRAAYEQAKAAGKTKLTYGQWVQVRTPNFKQWFGDWEAVRAKDALQEMQPVIITADEVLQNGTITEVRQRAKQVYDSAAKLGPVHMQDGRTVQLTGVGFRETKSHSADRKVLELMASIREVLEKATALASKPHKLANSTDSIRAWHYYGAKVNLRGKEFLAKLVVRESVNGQIYYDNDLSSMEEIGGRAVGATPANPEAAAGSADGLNLAQWWNSVNPAEVSKVIDPQTGEPMVQYHGTNDSGYFKNAQGQTQSATGNSGEFDTDNPDIRFSRKASRDTPRDTPPDVQPHIDRLAAHAQNIRNQRAQALQQAQHEAQRPITDKARTATHEAAQSITDYARQGLHDFQTQREQPTFVLNKQGHLTFTPGQAAWDFAKAITGPILNRFGMKNASPQLRRQLREMRHAIEQAQRKAANVAHAMQAQTDELRASLRLNSPLLPVADWVCPCAFLKYPLSFVPWYCTIGSPVSWSMTLETPSPFTVATICANLASAPGGGEDAVSSPRWN